jgi:hypothetical protein
MLLVNGQNAGFPSVSAVSTYHLLQALVSFVCVSCFHNGKSFSCVFVRSLVRWPLWGPLKTLEILFVVWPRSHLLKEVVDFTIATLSLYWPGCRCR